LWDLAVERLLVETNDLGFRTSGYPDDIAVIVQGKFTHTVRELMPWMWLLNGLLKRV
jgi:hypothetical protein